MNYYLHTYRILGTRCHVTDVYEDYAGHQTFTHLPNGERVGLITSRPIPAEMDALRYGDERIRQVRGHYTALDAERDQIVTENEPHEAGWLQVTK